MGRLFPDVHNIMAKIRSQLIGQGSGSIGNQVIYQSGGSTIVRAKAASVANPKTANQSVQRCILATSSKLTAALRGIVDHSFETKSVGRESEQYFQSITMQALRSAAAASLDGSATIIADYNLKGSSALGFVQGMVIAKGSLTIAPQYVAESADYADGIQIGAGSTDLSTAFSTQEGYEAALAVLGLAPGDQLSIIACERDTTQPSASYDGKTDYEDYIIKARYTFAPTLPEGFNGTLVNASTKRLNEELIVEKEGAALFAVVLDDVANRVSFFEVSGSEAYAPIWFAAVRTQKQADGRYKYSNSHIVLTPAAGDLNTISPSYKTYMAGTSEIDLDPSLFLQNAEQDDGGSPAPVEILRSTIELPESSSDIDGVLILSAPVTADEVVAHLVIENDGYDMSLVKVDETHVNWGMYDQTPTIVFASIELVGSSLIVKGNDQASGWQVTEFSWE